MMPATAALLAAAAVASTSAQEQRPICKLGETLTASVDMHLADWDSQVEFGLNGSLNCSEFLEYVYLSRDRIRQQLDYTRGNFTAEDEAFRAQGSPGGSSAWAMTHLSAASSLVSAHIHIHGVLAAARPECLSEHLQLLFLMSLRRVKTLLHSQLRHLWVVLEGRAELVRQAAGKWLTELVDLFEADLRTMESIMVNWRSAEEIAEAANGSEIPSRPGPPLPAFSVREADGIALSTVEVLRRDTFEEWNVPKPLLRALLRYVLPRDSHVADFCAGSGTAATFLNDTGLVKAYAFDPSPNIKLLSKNMVDVVRLHADKLDLWTSFDITMCISSAADYGERSEVWSQVWKNLALHTKRAAILSCGTGEVRRLALSLAAEHAPELQLDDQLSGQLDAVLEQGLCIFWRRPSAPAA
eukprot:TRINITY_DN76567_c0_g1_i1.p1 TRINITY_DN76567_c0_g1~~TRINITY_DN76567_c0_g1_i1.p1  ORF type:complete len:412 (+),score=111.23 TRINITY_DN76567_c0_g1_i1:65-1300(+)